MTLFEALSINKEMLHRLHEFGAKPDDCRYIDLYRDYLDVLNVLRDHRFIYFTSNKSSIVELCSWLGKNRDLGNPFAGCHVVEFHAQMNYNATYTDMMIYNAA